LVRRHAALECRERELHSLAVPARRIVPGGEAPKRVVGIDGVAPDDRLGYADHHLGVVGIEPHGVAVGAPGEIARKTRVGHHCALERSAEGVAREAAEERACEA
jgi:hypothetical protein